MAQLVATLRLEWRGLDACMASFQSIAEAASNAYVDDIEIGGSGEGFLAMGMTIARIEIEMTRVAVLATVSPTASMILFIAAVMAKLPSTARVTWRDGWPHVTCPPNDDREGADDPAPLVPDALVLA